MRGTRSATNLNTKVPLQSFAAGTPIHTSRGDVPIEQIEVGDEVLAQDRPRNRIVPNKLPLCGGGYQSVAESIRNPAVLVTENCLFGDLTQMKSALLLLAVTGCLGILHGQQSPPNTHDRNQDPQFQATLRDFDQTIGLLEKAERQHWSQDRLRKAFVAIYGPGISSGSRMTACGYPVLLLLTPHTPLDERPPFAVETSRALAQCQSQRAFLEELIRSQNSDQKGNATK